MQVIDKKNYKWCDQKVMRLCPLKGKTVPNLNLAATPVKAVQMCSDASPLALLSVGSLLSLIASIEIEILGCIFIEWWLFLCHLMHVYHQHPLCLSVSDSFYNYMVDILENKRFT